jgi:hypothetical protein
VTEILYVRKRVIHEEGIAYKQLRNILKYGREDVLETKKIV